MAATLIALRWRLTLNAVRRSPWMIVGAVLGGLYGLSALGMLVPGAVALGHYVPAPEAAVILGALGALLVAGWIVVPLLLTGVDSTLDPRAMAAWASPSRRLALGLLAAGACGIPGVITALVCLLPVLSWLVAGEPLAALMALLCAPAALATCVLVSRVLVTWAGVSASRRGRETAGVIAMVLVLACSVAPGIIGRALESQGSLGALRSLAAALAWSPLGWAFSAPGLLATGPLWGALAAAAGAWLIPLVLVRPWQRLVARVMTTAGRPVNRSQSYAQRTTASSASTASTAGTAGGPAGAAITAPQALAWARRLTLVIPGLPPACAAIAARCLRYWRSDPRYLLQVITIVMVPLLVAMPILGGSRILINGRSVHDSLTTGQGPLFLLLIVPFLVLMMGWALHDDIGHDSTAVWSHLSAGVPGWQDLAGRALAALAWQAPLALALGAGACLWTGRWDAAPALAGGCLALHGCALAWSCATSVLLPYEVGPPGASPMNARTSGTIILISLIQVVGMLVIALAAMPIGIPAIAVVINGWTAWGWLLLPLGLAWGGGALVLGVRTAGGLLDRRGPDLLATIQSWPGHSQPV